MQNLALTLPIALFSSALFSPTLAASSITVWIPEQGQTATLGAAGLVGAAGNRIPLNVEPYKLPLEQPMANGFAQLYFGVHHPKARLRLDVVQGGKIIASRPWPKTRAASYLWGTRRGPCVSDTDQQGGSPMLRCFSPDLKTEWAKVSGWQVMSVSQSGEFAFLQAADWWKPGKTYRPDMPFMRYDLNSGHQTPLSYHVPHTAEEMAAHQSMFDTYGAQDTIYVGAELPGERFAVCTAMVGLKWNCGGDIMSKDGKRLLTFQGTSFLSSQALSRDGSRLYGMGNTLQVWDTQTGQRLASIHDPLWDKRGDSPFRAYLTPDNTQAVIFTRGYDPKVGPLLNQATAYVYRLNDGKRLSRFVLKP